MILCLTGFMGCGKSSVGKALAARLGVPFTDLDAHIEAVTQRRIPELFRAYGEAGFRTMECTALEEVLTAMDDGMTHILSLGGGTLTTPRCAELIRRKTHCIYLRNQAETLCDNLLGAAQGRPLLQGADSPEALRVRVGELLRSRGPVYARTAHVIVDTDGLGAEDAAERIMRACADILK